MFTKGLQYNPIPVCIFGGIRHTPGPPSRDVLRINTRRADCSAPTGGKYSVEGYLEYCVDCNRSIVALSTGKFRAVEVRMIYCGDNTVEKFELTIRN